jgi:dsDNA-binding SOS-regulon protein
LVNSVSFEPISLGELTQFLEENKDTYHEIWVIIKNKKAASPQVVSFNDVVSEAKKQGLIDSRIKKNT